MSFLLFSVFFGGGQLRHLGCHPEIPDGSWRFPFTFLEALDRWVQQSFEVNFYKKIVITLGCSDVVVKLCAFKLYLS